MVEADGRSAAPPEDQRAVIAFLSRPEAYRLPPQTTVERIDTHSAVVFLVGDRAYKLKRAVKFPFLDFSTRDLRRRFCADEVTLNRRTAPHHYLGVVPVMQAGKGLRLGDMVEPDRMPVEAADWLVVMRRFDQDQLLSEVAARGALSVAIVVDLACTIARFHASAQPLDEFGGGARLAESVAMDVAQMIARGDLLDPALGRELAEVLPQEASRLAPAADARRSQGAIRRCHGDLHLGNIFLEDGRPIPFDGIEFNPRLSCVDVLYDLAFLLMDLDFRDLRIHASAALNNYLWRTAETDEAVLSGLALLPIYLARRAAIRAHVEAAGIPHIADRALATAARDRACAYQRYARALFPPAAPELVAVGGLSGTGKTTLAMALAPEIGATPGAVVVRSDVLRKRMAGIALEARMPEGWYTPANTAAVYSEMHRLAGVALRAGRSVVLDAVYARPTERAAAAEIAGAAGVPFHGFWLEAPTDLLQQRIVSRQGDASDATPAVVERQTEYDLGDIEWNRLDATETSPQIAGKALASLRRGG